MVMNLNIKLPSEGSAADTRFVSIPQFLHPTPNPIAAPTRRLPLDIGANFSEIIRLTFKIPEGYEPESFPASVNLRLPDDAGSFQFVYSAGADSRSVDVMSRFVLRKSTYSPEEYVALRTLYEQMLAKHAELLTLKRKS